MAFGYVVIAVSCDGRGDPQAAFVVDTARRRASYFGPEGREPTDPARDKSTVAKAIRDAICAGGRLDRRPDPGDAPPVVICVARATRFLSRLAYLCAQPRHGSAFLPPWLLEDPRVVLDATALVPDGWEEIAEAYAPADPAEADKLRARVAAIGRGERSLQHEAAVLVYLLEANGYIARPEGPLASV